MATLALAIVHAPWAWERRGMVAAINAAALAAQRSLPILARHVVEDTRREGVWPTTRRAWKLLLMSGASHLLVLQDDAGLCHDFFRTLLDAIEAKPDEMLALYSARADVGRALVEGKHWVTSPGAICGPGVVLPAAMASDFLAWERRRVRPEYPHDDVRLALYAEENGRMVWSTAPSLVQHLAPSNSLLGNGNKNRVAHTFLGNGPVPAIDWSRGAQDPYRGSGSLASRADYQAALLDGTLSRAHRNQEPRE